MPERLGASYVAEDGARRVPVMLHRAIFGSFERMIGILIEHYAGRFPLWLAPTQAVVVTIVNDADSYANELASKLRAAGMRIVSGSGIEVCHTCIHARTALRRLRGLLGRPALAPGFDSLDAFLSHMWAVTVIGAPKKAAAMST